MATKLWTLANQQSYNTQLKAWTEGTFKIVEQATPETGYLKTYVLQANGTNAASSAKINIPKDYLVKSASIETAEAVDTPIAGLAVGDKYFDFTINTVGGDGTESHIYIAAEDAFTAYTQGAGITISGTEISARIGDGLQTNASTDATEVKVGDGITINSTSKAVEAKVGTGLEINATSKAIDVVAQNATSAADANAPAIGGVTKADYVAFKGAADTFSATAGTPSASTVGNTTTTTTTVTVASTDVGGTATTDAFHFNVVDTTYGNATASVEGGAAAAAGLMSGADKDNLDALIAALGSDVALATSADVDALFA